MNSPIQAAITTCDTAVRDALADLAADIERATDPDRDQAWDDGWHAGVDEALLVAKQAGASGRVITALVELSARDRADQPAPADGPAAV